MEECALSVLDFEDMTKLSELSVFFPTYNEEENIKKVVLSAKKVLLKIAEKWEIIVINDGSKDKTKEVVESLAKGDRRISVITHRINKGYGGALKTGFINSKYEWVCFTDSDGQFDFSEISKFTEKQKDTSADLILGYRIKRADSFIRRAGAFFWFLFPRILWGLNVRDYSCGFKLIKREVFNSIQPLIGEEKVTQIEMLVKAKKFGFKFAEVGVNHYPRRFGKQTGADFKVVAKSFIDLFKLWQQLK